MAVEKKLWTSNELPPPGLERSLYDTQRYPQLEKFELAGGKNENQIPFIYFAFEHKI